MTKTPTHIVFCRTMSYSKTTDNNDSHKDLLPIFSCENKEEEIDCEEMLREDLASSPESSQGTGNHSFPQTKGTPTTVVPLSGLS